MDVTDPDEIPRPTRTVIQIGEVATLTNLSIRTIRHWEEMGLVQPTARSAGGFRLYSDEDVARIRLLRYMKPLNFTLDQMRELIALRETVTADSSDRLSGLVWPAGDDAPDAATTVRVAQDLERYVALAEQRLGKLREEIRQVEEFVRVLREEARRASDPPAG
ncbi:MerR family transcriptional regulator [Microbacterium sp.]|uniref:MerR family transcriptional regulator n=1 Tax=Microbacterium sp. TaxID=51671 RepID=UPI003C783797